MPQRTAVLIACFTLLWCPADAADEQLRSDLIVRATALVGSPYRNGGSSPVTGFDCSGLVRYVFGSAAQVDLPRRSEEMALAGVAVERDALMPGDLVFFNTLRRPNSHVGIFIGDHRFVHAPTAGGRVRIESMLDRYWQTRYDGARRVLGPRSRLLPAARIVAEEPIRP